MNAFSNLAFNPNVLHPVPTLLCFPLILLYLCCAHLPGRHLFNWLHAPVPGTSSNDLPTHTHHVPKPLHANCPVLVDQQEFISCLHPLKSRRLNLSCVLGMNKGSGSGPSGGAQSMGGASHIVLFTIVFLMPGTVLDIREGQHILAG